MPLICYFQLHFVFIFTEPSLSQLANLIIFSRRSLKNINYIKNNLNILTLKKKKHINRGCFTFPSTDKMIKKKKGLMRNKVKTKNTEIRVIK